MKQLTKAQSKLLELIVNASAPKELYFKKDLNVAMRLQEMGLVSIHTNELNQSFASALKPFNLLLEQDELLFIQHAITYLETTKREMKRRLMVKVSSLLNP